MVACNTDQMRRVYVSAIAVAAMAGVAFAAGVGVASAAPAPAPSEAAAAPIVPGEKVCTVDNERLVELSGLVAYKSGFIVINDSTEFDSRERVFYLNADCAETKNVRYSGNGPRDTEDLAVSPDGKTLWIADTGDNPTSTDRRQTVVLWSMPIGGGKEPELHRFAYPDGQARDAEALLISADNVPVIITKAFGPAELFVPAAAIKTDNSEPVALKKVGEVTLPATETPNPLSAAGRSTVTGAARSADGTKVALRTYADAFEWDVTGGDVVATLTGATAPRVTALADPFGEAIAYTRDGTQFLTVSDAGQLGEDQEISILSYTPTKPVAAVPPSGPAGGGGGSWTDRISLKDITYLIAVVGLIGLLLVGAGIFGIMRSRKRKATGGPRGRRRSARTFRHGSGGRPRARTTGMALRTTGMAARVAARRPPRRVGCMAAVVARSRPRPVAVVTAVGATAVAATAAVVRPKAATSTAVAVGPRVARTAVGAVIRRRAMKARTAIPHRVAMAETVIPARATVRATRTSATPMAARSAAIPTTGAATADSMPGAALARRPACVTSTSFMPRTLDRPSDRNVWPAP